MGTCNFKTSDTFRNFCITYEPPSEKEVRDVELEGYTFDFDEHEDTFYDDIRWTFDNDKDNILDNNRIYYFDIKLQYGYYDGVMLEVIPNKTVGISYSIDELEHPDDIDSGYLGYNLGNWKPNKIYSSQIKRAIKSEINTINKKVLPKLANLLGMKEIRCAGVFSNGEAIYELM